MHRLKRRAARTALVKVNTTSTHTLTPDDPAMMMEVLRSLKALTSSLQQQVAELQDNDKERSEESARSRTATVQLRTQIALALSGAEAAKSNAEKARLEASQLREQVMQLQDLVLHQQQSLEAAEAARLHTQAQAAAQVAALKAAVSASEASKSSTHACSTGSASACVACASQQSDSHQPATSSTSACPEPGCEHGSLCLCLRDAAEPWGRPPLAPAYHSQPPPSTHNRQASAQSLAAPTAVAEDSLVALQGPAESSPYTDDDLDAEWDAWVQSKGLVQSDWLQQQPETEAPLQQLAVNVDPPSSPEAEAYKGSGSNTDDDCVSGDASPLGSYTTAASSSSLCPSLSEAGSSCDLDGSAGLLTSEDIEEGECAHAQEEEGCDADVDGSALLAGEEGDGVVMLVVVGRGKCQSQGCCSAAELSMSASASARSAAALEPSEDPDEADEEDANSEEEASAGEAAACSGQHEASCQQQQLQCVSWLAKRRPQLTVQTEWHTGRCAAAPGGEWLGHAVPCRECALSPRSAAVVGEALVAAVVRQALFGDDDDDVE